MKLTIKRCLLGLIASATMFSVIQAQEDEPIGTVKLGPNAQLPSSPASAGTVPLAPDQSTDSVPPGTLRFPASPGPLTAPFNQPGMPPGQSGVPGPQGAGSFYQMTASDVIFTPRFFVSSYGGGLYGYGSGYSTMGAFVPYKLDNDSLLFTSGMGLVTYDGKGGASVGGGWRHYMEDLDRIVGLSAWFDFDNGHYQPFQQLGLSFESLGRYIDYRVNGYVPISNPNHIISQNLTTNAVLQGSTIGLLQQNSVEQSYSGFDAELGGPTPFLGRYGLNAYIGGYNFSGNGTHGGNFQGVSGRLLAQINEDVSFGVQVTDDHLFGLNTQFQVFVNLPSGKSSRWMRNLSVKDRLTQNVFRQYRVVAHTDNFTSYVTAINPNTNKPYFVANINPNLAVNGNGSAQSPFNSVAAYEALTPAQQQQYSIILVQPRTDGTHTNLDTSTTLDIYSGQRLLSTTVAQTFLTANIPNTPVTLPGTSTGADPLLYNSSGGNVITMVGGNTYGEQVSGFQIVGSTTGNGIFGNNVLGANISNNIINSGLNGVLINNLSGTLAAGTEALIQNNTISNNVNNGIEVHNSAANPLFVVVQGNTFNGNGGDGLQLGALNGSNISGIIGGPNSAATGTTPAVTLSNTFENNKADGLDLIANAGTLNFSPPVPAVTQTAMFGVANNAPGIYNNIFTGNTLDGLHINSTNNSTTNFTVTNNSFGLASSTTSGNLEYGIGLVADSGTNSIEIGGALITNADGTSSSPGNVFNFNAISAINLAASAGTLNYDINNNSISNGVTTTAAAPHDEFVFAFNGTSGTNPFTITNNSDPGVSITSVVWNLAGTAATIAPTTGAAGANPVVVQPINDTFLSSLNNLPVLTGTTPLQMQAIAGVANTTNTGLAAGTQLIPMGFTGFAPKDQFQAKSLFEQTGGSAALTSAATNGSTLTVTFSNGLVSTQKVTAAPTVGPIAVSATGDVFGTSTPGFGTGSDGIHVIASGSATLGTSSIENNTVTGYGGYGIHVETAGAATAANVVINNNILTSNGTGVSGAGLSVFTGGGLQVGQGGTSNITALVENNTINSNFNFGDTVLANGTGGSANIISQDNVSTNNANNGFNLSASGGTTVNLISNRDDFIGNGGGSAKNPSSTGGDDMSISTAGTTVSNITFNNVLANSSSGSGLSSANTATGNGLSVTTSNGSILNLTIASPTDPLFTRAATSEFSNNKLNGLLFTTNDTSNLNFSISNTVMNSNTLNGIAFNRTAASLVLGTIANSSMNSNTQNGFAYQGLGGDPTDPTQQHAGTPNTINLNNDTLNTNGISTNALPTGDGAYLNLFGQSVLVLNATTSVFENNNANGLRVDLSPGAQFGYQSGNIYSNFDNVTMTGNGANGIMFTSISSQLPAADAQSSTYFNLNSAVGNTVISNNIGNGILTQYVSGTQNVLIQGDGRTTPIYQTLIQANGGDGIQFDVGGAATGTLNVVSGTGTTSDVLIGGPTASNSNKGNGINFQDVSLFTINSSQNGGSTTWSSGTSGFGILNVSYATIQNNDLNGINLVGNGLEGGITLPNAAGVATPYENTPGNGAGLLFATIANSQIINNAQDGVDIEISGRMGFGGHSGGEANALTFTNNIISNNGNDGIFLETNAGQQIRSSVASASAAFIGYKYFNLPTTPGTVPLNWLEFAASFAPGSTTDYNYGSNATGGFLLSNWMNLEVNQLTTLQMYNNTIQYNGRQPNVTLGDGLHIRVGTDTYLSADIGGTAGAATGNTFGGNVHTDMYVESFLSYNPATGQSPTPGTGPNAAPGTASTNAASATALSTVFLDDTAQFDLQFNNNTGNTIKLNNVFLVNGQGSQAPSLAFYPNDPVKDYNDFPNAPNSGLTRGAQLFEVYSPTLNTSNNFTSLGVTENIQNAFANGGWDLDSTAFTLNNAAFPRDSNASPGNPFLP